jgi:hypothetical protein
MQLPSLYHVAAEAGRVAHRFLLTLLSGLVLCVAGCQALGQPEWPQGWVSMLILALAAAGILALPLREGTFRVQRNYLCDSLKLQQQRAAGTWQTRLSLSLAPLTDSLMQHYDHRHARPVGLRAPAGRLHLRLLFASLRRDGAGQEVRYFYSAQGELRLEP